MNKTKIVLGVVLLLLICGLLYLNFNKKENNSVVDDAKEVVSIQKDVVNKKEVDSSTENIIKTYRSEKLGVEFDYAMTDPLFTETRGDNVVVEKGNIITTEPGGGQIEIFKKDPQVTVENALKILFPNCKIKVSSNSDAVKKFYNENMSILAEIYFPEARYFGDKEGVVRDVRPGDNGDFILSNKDKKCIQELDKLSDNYYFVTDSDSSDKFIGIPAITQSPDGVLRRDGGSIITWMSTVRFVE